MTKEPVGSVAEEAAKLFAVLQQAAAEAQGGDAAGKVARGETQPARQDPVDGDLSTEPGAARAGAGVDDAASVGSAEFAGGGSSGPGEEHRHGLGRGVECQWCPVCQVINKVRSTSPETIEQLSTAAAGVLGSVRSLLEAAAEAARQARVDAESRTTGEQDPERPARSRVDRIDVSEDPEPWD